MKKYQLEEICKVCRCDDCPKRGHCKALHNAALQGYVLIDDGGTEYA